MKKLLLSLGAIASVAAPVAAVVACGSTPEETKTIPMPSSKTTAQLAGIEASSVTDLATASSELGINLTTYQISDVTTTWDKTTSILKIEGKMGDADNKQDVTLVFAITGSDVKVAPTQGVGAKPVTIEDNAANFQKINQALSAVNAKYKLYKASDSLFSGKTIIARPNNEGSLILKSVKDQAFLDALTFSELQTQNLLDSHSVVTHLSDTAIVGGTNNIVKGATVSNPEYGYKAVTTGYVLDRDGTYYHFTSLEDFNDAIAGSTLPLWSSYVNPFA